MVICMYISMDDLERMIASGITAKCRPCQPTKPTNEANRYSLGMQSFDVFFDVEAWSAPKLLSSRLYVLRDFNLRRLAAAVLLEVRVHVVK